MTRTGDQDLRQREEWVLEANNLIVKWLENCFVSWQCFGGYKTQNKPIDDLETAHWSKPGGSWGVNDIISINTTIIYIYIYLFIEIEPYDSL